MPHSFEWIINAAKNSKPTDEQLAEWAKRDAEMVGIRWHEQTKANRSALTGWDGRTVDIENINYANSYAEQGYSDPETAILFADWNSVSQRVQDILERCGYELEWEDEWTTCGSCGKAVRTSADSYVWQPSYILENECEITCVECISDSPESYLESIEDDPRTALNIRAIDPSKHGYILIQKDFENGFHPGQTDDPKKIYDELTKDGHSRIIFRIDDVSQFDMRFSVWEHESTHIFTWNGSLSDLSLSMTLEQAESVSHQGQCHEDVKQLIKEPKISEQLEKMQDDDIIKELRETGAWQADEMLDRETNLQRIVWLAGCDIKENKETYA